MHSQPRFCRFCSYILNTFIINACRFVLGSASEEDLGSSEEEGKDWDDLEKEAREGGLHPGYSLACTNVIQWCVNYGSLLSVVAFTGLLL